MISFKIISSNNLETIHIEEVDPLDGISEEDNTKMYEYCDVLPSQIRSEISKTLHATRKDFKFDQFAEKAVSSFPNRQIYAMYVDENNIEEAAKKFSENLYLAYKTTTLNKNIREKINQLQEMLLSHFNSPCKKAIVDIIVGVVNETLFEDLSEIFDVKFKINLEREFCRCLTEFFTLSLKRASSNNIFQDIELITRDVFV